MGKSCFFRSKSSRTSDSLKVGGLIFALSVFFLSSFLIAPAPEGPGAVALSTACFAPTWSSYILMHWSVLPLKTLVQFSYWHFISSMLRRIFWMKSTPFQSWFWYTGTIGTVFALLKLFDNSHLGN